MKRVVWLPGLVLLLAGMASLMLEMVWARRFALVFGGTVPAGAAVLGAYLAGLAVGAAWLGRRADRVRHPYRMLAVLLAGIALLAVGSLAFAHVLPMTYEILVRDAGLPRRLAQFGVAIFFLMPPAILMGGLLPVAVCGRRDVRESNAGVAVGWLHGVNCVGSAGGALLAALILVPGRGLNFTTWAAAGVALAAALAAAVVPGARDGTPTRASRVQARQAAAPVVTPIFPVALAFAAGMLTMMCQVTQFRIVSFLTTGTLASFAIVSAVYVFALGLGSAAGGAWIRLTGGSQRRLLLMQAAALALAAAGAGWSAPMLDRAGRGGAEILGAALAVSPAAVPLGLLFPLLVAGIHPGKERTGRAVGTVSAALELGSVVGPFLGGLLLLPAVGTRATLTATAATAAGLALVVFYKAVRVGAPLRPLWRAGWTLLFAGAMASALLPPLRTELYRGAILRQIERDVGPGGRIVRLHEGIEGVVSVAAVWQEKEAGELRLLYVGRNLQSDNSTPWRRIERAMGALPGLLAPRCGGAAFHVGLGSGTTAAWSATVAPARRLRVAEMVPGVAAQMDLSAFPGRAPPFEIRVGEGRSLLAAEAEGLDLVVTDIVFPELDGAGGLFSLEYFRLVHSRLADDGLFVHWLPLWQMSPLALQATVRAFLDVFPEATLWAVSLNPGRPLAGLAGVRGGGAAFRPAAVERRIGRANGVRETLAALNLDRSVAVGSYFVAGSEELSVLAGAAPASTDDLALAEFYGSGQVHRNPGSENLRLLLDVWSADEAWPPGTPASAAIAETREEMRTLRAARRELAEVNLALGEAVQFDWSPRQVLPLLDRLRSARALAPRDPEIAYELWDLLVDVAASASSARQMDQARRALQEALEIGPRRDFVLRQLAIAKAVGGAPGDGLAEARDACRLNPDNPANWRVLEQVALSAGETAEAQYAGRRARSGKMENAGR